MKTLSFLPLLCVLAACTQPTPQPSPQPAPDVQTPPMAESPAPPPQAALPSTPVSPPAPPARPPVNTYQATGIAISYPLLAHGQATASGQSYDIYGLTAAHPTLPFGAQVLVTQGLREKVVTITDRISPETALIKLSYQVAADLGVSSRGEIVRVQGIGYAEPVAASMSAQSYTANNGMYLQAGAFADLRNAQQLQQRLTRQFSYPVTLQTVGQPARLYRVRIGPLASMAIANTVTKQLQQQGIRPILVR